MGDLAREHSVWNMIVHGRARVPLADKEAPSIICDKEKSSYCDEKVNPEERDALLSHSDLETQEHGGCSNGSTKRRDRILSVFFGLIIGTMVYLVQYPSTLSMFFTSPSPHGCVHLPKTVSVASLVDETWKGFSEELSGTSGNESVEVIEVGYPFVPPKWYGSPVYESLLINHTFGNSWGNPAESKFVPPANVSFDKVVLTLRTTSSGVQYDRLANLFVDGVEIWRTSTAEPGGRSIVSFATKDVSVYTELFKNPASILFDLPNILTGRLTGLFHVQLSIQLYDSHGETDESDPEAQLKASIFSTHKPASRVHAILPSRPHKPLVVYLPSDKIRVQLPTVPQNTTRLRLLILTSGNAAEEFWYANVLDKYAHRFDEQGNTLQGHGPTRFVNVNFNGEKIATQTPDPIVFSGGISPALWSRVVATRAFDLPAIDLDVTGLLPLLWEHQAVADRILEIEISNGIDELDRPFLPEHSQIGENWITSANLLSWENSDVVESSGDIVNIDDKARATVVSLAPPFSGTIQQVITSILNTEVTSNLTFVLGDDQEINTTVIALTKAEIANVQHYLHFGSVQLVVHVGHSSKNVTIATENDQLYKLDTSYSYPLVLNSNEKNHSVVPGDVNIEYDVKLELVRVVDVTSPTMHLEVSSAQNGLSKYFLSNQGNHGTGSLTTKYKMKVDGERKYKRKVDVVNGTVVEDKESYEKHLLDTPKEDNQKDQKDHKQHKQHKQNKQHKQHKIHGKHNRKEAKNKPVHKLKGHNKVHGVHHDKLKAFLDRFADCSFAHQLRLLSDSARERVFATFDKIKVN